MNGAESRSEITNALKPRAPLLGKSWETGLLDPEQWTGKWIGPQETPKGYGRQRPAYWLAVDFNVPAPIESAVLHSTARGLYEAFLNGRRVGDLELTPGFTAYRRRLQVHSFDVAHFVQPGDNLLATLLSDGWWRGQNGFARRVDDYGPTTSFFAQLVVTMTNGETLVMNTDERWRCTESHVLRADLIAGEVHDLRCAIDWRVMTSTQLREWSPVRLGEEDFDQLCLPVGPPVRKIEELLAKEVRRVGANSWVVDFGQNSNGWVRLSNLGQDGNQVSLTYGEAVDANNEIIHDNEPHVWMPVPEASTVPFQVDTVIASGRDGEVFEPRHSTKGFQFVRIDGIDELGPSEIASVVVHSDVAKIGEFECSSDDINRLHSIAEWGFRGNICDIPTDCPTRERAGWTGDWQVYIETASYLYDVTGFCSKWLRDLSAEQLDSGVVHNFAPDPHPGDDRPPANWIDAQGSSGWGDATIHVPWQLYLSTGDPSLLANQWESMLSWHEYCARSAATGRHQSRVAISETPLPYEQYLWDTGFHFGEWLEPGVNLKPDGKPRTDDFGPVATAFLFRSAQELAQIAEVLGNEADAARLHAYAELVRDAWRTAFINEDGDIEPATQANLTRALAFGLVPDDLRPRVAEHLAQLIKDVGIHLGTGVLSTAFLLPMLAENDHLDLAYEILFTRDAPSWLVMVDRGATTLWEEWEGIDENGKVRASLNHYGKGAVISFLHRYVGGLQIIEPGYRSFAIRPRPGGGLTSARTHHVSPYGRIEVAWELSGPSFHIEITVPEGTTGRLEMPGGGVEILTAGHHHRQSLH